MLPAARPSVTASVIYRAEYITSSRLAYGSSYGSPYPTVARMFRSVARKSLPLKALAFSPPAWGDLGHWLIGSWFAIGSFPAAS
jgi:hypothetical protein